MRNQSAFRNTAIERVTKDVKLLTLLVLRTQMDPFQNFQNLVANVPVIQSIVGAAINFLQEIVSQPQPGKLFFSRQSAVLQNLII
jgi:hypothetical protein